MSFILKLVFLVGLVLCGLGLWLVDDSVLNVSFEKDDTYYQAQP